MNPFEIISRLQSGTEKVVRHDEALAAVEAMRNRACKAEAELAQVKAEKDRLELVLRAIAYSGKTKMGMKEDALRALGLKK